MEVHDLADYERHPGGRPTDYRPEFCKIAAEMAEGGATDFEIAQALECHPVTMWRWQAKHPEFRRALKLGKEAADERVERSLFHRATGYSYPTVKIMQDKGTPLAVKYIEHVPPDPGAALTWLKNRQPEKWRDRRELTGADGSAINFTIFVPPKAE
jgi:hypothetical protein